MHMSIWHVHIMNMSIWHVHTTWVYATQCSVNGSYSHIYDTLIYDACTLLCMYHIYECMSRSHYTVHVSYIWVYVTFTLHCACIIYMSVYHVHTIVWTWYTLIYMMHASVVWTCHTLKYMIHAQHVMCSDSMCSHYTYIISSHYVYLYVCSPWIYIWHMYSISRVSLVLTLYMKTSERHTSACTSIVHHAP